MKVLDFIVAEDIRFEMAGKISIIGLLDDGIFINSPEPEKIVWPIPFKLGIHASLQPTSEASKLITSFELSILHNGAVAGGFNGPVKITNPGQPLRLNLVAFPFPLQGPGNLSFRIRFKKGDLVAEELAIDRMVAVNVVRIPYQ